MNDSLVDEGSRSVQVFNFEQDREKALIAFETLDTETLADPGRSLTPAAAQALGTAALLPVGSEVNVRSETWERTGRLGAVVVEVLPPGSAAPDVFVAYLVETQSGWRLSHTETVGV